MLPQKYHAIAFLCILVMLLLLGLHLLGFSFLRGGDGSANAIALARNSTGGSNSSPIGASSTLNPNSIYRHPIIYDKLTGATNSQINDVLGSNSKQDQFPLDHYQQQQQQHRQQQQLQLQHQLNRNQNPFERFGGPEGGDPFANHLAQTGRPFRPLGPPMRPPPPPPPPPRPPPPVDTVNKQPSRQQPANAELGSQPQQDSIPSASSLYNDGFMRPRNSSRGSASEPRLAPYYRQQPQPVYYTPPIFTYSDLDGAQHQHQSGSIDDQPPPPLGVPEVPLSVDEFNARQSRLRQLTSGQSSDDKQPVNLLADPRAQQQHKHEMLDRELLFGPSNGAHHHRPPLGFLQRKTHPSADPIGPSYAHPTIQSAQSLPGQEEPFTRVPYQQQQQQQQQQSKKFASSQDKLMSGQRQFERPDDTGPKLLEPVVGSGHHQAPMQQIGSSLSSRRPAAGLEPTCARQLQAPPMLNAELVNSTSQLPAVICNEDSEYPTADIMRALEQYASERPIERVIPQQLVQLLTQNRASIDLKRQLDPLQASINNEHTTTQQQQVANELFPSNNYESLCASTSWIAQPRRAKNLAGQWKVVVNLPGHKYRGVAISQMVRLEECVRPNGECSFEASPSLATTTPIATQLADRQRAAIAMPPRSRCLQNYGNQRLLAWSQRQGLHFDIFRVPIACSCHIRRL